MLNKFKFYLYVFWQMLKVELLIYKRSLVSLWIDTTVLVVCFVFISTYILTALGMPISYGGVVATGAMANGAVWGIWTFASLLLSDICGDKKINYFLALPIPSWLVFVKQATAFAIRTTVVALIILPVSKLVMLGRFDLSALSIVKCLIILAVLNFCASFMSLFLTSLITEMIFMESIWTRVMMPMWFLGCSQFTFDVLYKVSPTLAKINLLNPMVYMMEGVRAAVFGSDKQSLSFAVCFLALCLFSVFFIWVSIRRLKKRLDFV